MLPLQLSLLTVLAVSEMVWTSGWISNAPKSTIPSQGMRLPSAMSVGRVMYWLSPTLAAREESDSWKSSVSFTNTPLVSMVRLWVPATRLSTFNIPSKFRMEMLLWSCSVPLPIWCMANKVECAESRVSKAPISTASPIMRFSCFRSYRWAAWLLSPALMAGDDVANVKSLYSCLNTGADADSRLSESMSGTFTCCSFGSLLMMMLLYKANVPPIVW